MSGYASGKRARGICDRCGFAFKLNDLKYEVPDDVRSGLRVCRTCYDIPHPQLDLSEREIYDPQALRDPRPDSAELAASRALHIPVWPLQRRAVGQVGQVSVSIE